MIWGINYIIHTFREMSDYAIHETMKECFYLSPGPEDLGFRKYADICNSIKV